MKKRRRIYLMLAIFVVICAGCYEIGRRSQALVRIAQWFIGQDKWQSGISVLELNTKLYHFDAKSHRALARAYFFHGERGKSRKSLQVAMTIQPNRLADVILLKKLNLVPGNFSPPILYETEHFTVRPISVSDADQDYAAVMSSLEHLKGVLGDDWPPAGLTMQEEKEVLALHEEQFERQELFVYTVLNPDQTRCIGCVYIGPSKLDDYDAQVTLWVTKKAFDEGLDDKLLAVVRDWLAASWPFERVVFPGREMTWASFYAQLEEQDKKYR